MFKKSPEKLLTPCPPPEIVISHTVTKNKTMRTKLFLAAAAIVAAGALSSQAQNVYSLNVVGYVNKTIPSGYSLIANPLSAGVTNGANEIATPVDGSVYLTWNGVGFDYTSFDSGFGGWIDAGFNPAQPPTLPPGRGFFFFNPGATYTNTFVGEVVPAPGSTNSLALPSGYSLVGSVLPAGSAQITAAPVSLPLIDGSVILQWNGVGYVYTSFDSGFGGWIDAAFNPAAEPSYTVADGFFFFNPGASAPWSQSLP